jgi:hypothetical protein
LCFSVSLKLLALRRRKEKERKKEALKVFPLFSSTENEERKEKETQQA